MLEKVVDLLVCWRCQRGNRLVKDVWRIAPLCLMWTIWRERNARCFENHEKTYELKNMFVKTLLNWAGAFNVSQLSIMPQFVGFCSSFCFWSVLCICLVY
jgi:hypothetical protein